MLDKLIGSQIVSINEDSIVVKLGEKTHTLEIVASEGDCCGYADFTTALLYSEGCTENPIVTNVELKNSGGSYSDSSVFTFYGGSRALATIESSAGSGSGWEYGACVYLVCKSLDIEEDLASW